MKLRTYHADGSLHKETAVTRITGPEESPNGLFLMCQVHLETGQVATLDPEHLDRFYPGWQGLLEEELEQCSQKPT